MAILASTEAEFVNQEGDARCAPSGGTEVPSKGAGPNTYRSATELAEDLGLSERSTRAALRRGEIPHIRIGRRFILPRAAIAEWLRTAGRNSGAAYGMTQHTKLAVVGSPR
jgi:excisionase family DNA binding protein